MWDNKRYQKNISNAISQPEDMEMIDLSLGGKALGDVIYYEAVSGIRIPRKGAGQ